MLFSRKRDELRTIEVGRVFEFMTVGDREMNGRGCLKFCAEKKSLIIVNFPKHSQVWGVSKQTLYFQQVLHACSVCHFSSWITSLSTCCVCLISLLIMFHFFQLFSSCVRSVFVPNVLNLNCSLLCLNVMFILLEETSFIFYHFLLPCCLFRRMWPTIGSSNKKIRQKGATHDDVIAAASWSPLVAFFVYFNFGMSWIATSRWMGGVVRCR